MKKSNGFTLIEVLITAVLIGMMSFLLSPVMNLLFVSQQKQYKEEQEIINRKISHTMLDYAETYNNNRLIDPYFEPGNIYSAFDTRGTNAQSQDLITVVGKNRLSVSELNDDESASENVRTYQKISITKWENLYGNTGPQIRIDYDLGAVYICRCSRSDGTCNPNAQGIGGERELLTNANMNNWPNRYPPYLNASGVEVTDNCLKPIFFSTYLLQKKQVENLVKRVTTIRAQLKSFFNAHYLLGSPGSSTNYFPDSGAATASQGCRKRWANLYSTSILTDIGLSKTEYGVTPWGGIIEYCSKYDPAGAGAGPPHYAAIRFSNRPMSTVSAERDPNPSNINDNIIISF
jgi:prepilin-type N-terminal cleavage/methylation domain-containing protein